MGNEMRLVSMHSTDKFIFTDVCDEHPDSVEMLKKMAGDEVDFSTKSLDITDIDAVRTVVKANDVKAIVNCAAFTNVDAAESNQETAELLNAQAPENLAVVMKEVGGMLVHISTDYVFGGDPYNTPCREEQKGTPTGVYGLTKLHGEQAIQKVGCNHVIIRTAWLYSEFGKNFVKTMLGLTASKPQLNVVFDQVGTPTYAFDLAQAISTILHDYHEERSDSQSAVPGYSKGGIYHFSNEGVCSWYDFTKMIAEYSQHTECDIQPCHSVEFPSPVKRPAYSVLDKTKIKETFKLKVPYWTASLHKCLDNIR